MNVSELNSDEQHLFTSIHNTFLPKRKQNFDIKGILSGKNLEYTNIIEPIIIKTKQILDMFNNKNYDLSQYYIEFHQRNCGFEKKYKRTFPWHEDNYGAVNFKVYTVIYYIRKDHTIKGGNLEYVFEKKNYCHRSSENWK